MADSVDVGNNTVFAELATWLTQLGLGALFTVGPDGEPGGWLMDRIRDGLSGLSELQTAVESTEVWQTRFAAIVQQRAEAAAGKPVRVMSVAEVVNYEQQAAAEMRKAGIPTWFWDEPSDFVELMVKQVSVAEVQQRLSQGYEMVQNVDPAIRQAFNDFYGTTSDEGLVAYFLDPDRSLDRVERAARASYAGGMARSYRLEMDRAMAERFASLPLSNEAIVARVQEASQMQALTHENFGEAQDLTDTDIFNAALGDGDATGVVQRRARSRQSVNREAIGGTLLTQEGAGLGSA